jgi:hypothetical protein
MTYSTLDTLSQYWLLYRCPGPDLVSQNWNVGVALDVSAASSGVAGVRGTSRDGVIFATLDEQARRRRRQCIRHAPSEREAVVHEVFHTRDLSLAGLMDDDMSHETVVEHGQRVPD